MYTVLEHLNNVIFSLLLQINPLEVSLWEKFSSEIKHHSFSDKCLPNVYVICTSWTGGNDLDLEGQYKWDYSKTTFNYTNWLPGEPNGDSNMNTRDCVDMFWTGQWNDRTCTHLGPFICEKPRM